MSKGAPNNEYTHKTAECDGCGKRFPVQKLEPVIVNGTGYALCSGCDTTKSQINEQWTALKKSGRVKLHVCTDDND